MAARGRARRHGAKARHKIYVDVGHRLSLGHCRDGAKPDRVSESTGTPQFTLYTPYLHRISQRFARFRIPAIYTAVLVVGEPYFDRLGRSVDRKRIYREAYRCRLSSRIIYDHTHTAVLRQFRTCPICVFFFQFSLTFNKHTLTVARTVPEDHRKRKRTVLQSQYQCEVYIRFSKRRGAWLVSESQS